MRIAYVSLHWPRTIHSGVGKKIAAQIGAWRAAGNEVTLFLHSHTIENASDLLPGVSELYERKSGFMGKILTEVDRNKALSRLIRKIHSYQPDVIYLRFNVFAYPLQRLFRGAPVIIEAVTNDIKQHETLGKFYALYNRLTRRISLKRCSGIVSISHELAASPAFADYHKPTIVVGDGIDLSKYPVIPAPKNQQPHLVFIGSPGNAWHGVEKLVPLAQQFPDLVIDVVGYDRMEGAENYPSNFVLHGYLKGDAYQKVLATADAAISSLSLHSIGMEESSPLKTRECVAMGIPIILPYHDTDLDALSHPSILKIPNTPDNVQTHTEEIYQFTHSVMGKRLDDPQIRDSIDSKNKESQRLEFFRKIVEVVSTK
jgi:hypothetical protein